jgi:hypothetical protein
VRNAVGLVLAEDAKEAAIKTRSGAEPVRRKCQNCTRLSKPRVHHEIAGRCVSEACGAKRQRSQRDRAAVRRQSALIPRKLQRAARSRAARACARASCERAISRNGAAPSLCKRSAAQRRRPANTAGRQKWSGFRPDQSGRKTGENRRKNLRSINTDRRRWQATRRKPRPELAGAYQGGRCARATPTP